jgi:spore maturation protein CgeB
MKIGFMIKWPKGSLDKVRGNVIGDELLGEALSLSINRLFPEIECKLYAENFLPSDKLDIMIYLNDIKPVSKYASQHVLYLQNGGYGESAPKLLKRLRDYEYDRYIFFSNKLLGLHLQNGGSGLFLPFGVDTDFFSPQNIDPNYSYEVSYVGNDIKGNSRSNKYLLPATSFDFGLFGNWRISKFRFWKGRLNSDKYKREFERISKGKISQQKVPVLYSSSKINLNCTLQDCVDWDVITLRTFEVLACKGFLITDVVPIAKETMKDCMVFTEGGENLKDQIEFYLRHPDIRAEIANTGYEYVHKHASVNARARELVNYLRS